MALKTLALITFACAILHLQGCVTTSALQDNTPHVKAVIPAANPSLDHYIAWIPRDTAISATAARAHVHVALGTAKEKVGKQLCGGAWILDGAVVERVGPLPVMKTLAEGGQPAWYYRVSHQPGMYSCNTATERQLYTALKTNLPDWISLRTAERQALSQFSKADFYHH